MRKTFSFSGLAVDKTEKKMYNKTEYTYKPFKDYPEKED